MSLRRKALSGAKWSGASSISLAVIQLLQITFLARVLAPADFGLSALALVVIGLVQSYADLGLSAAIVHRQDATREQLSSLYWLNLFAGLAGLVVVVAAAGPLALLLGNPGLEAVIRWSAVALPVAALGQPFAMQLQRDLRFGILAASDGVFSLTMFAFAVTFAAHGSGVYSLVWGQLAGATARSLFLCVPGLMLYKPLLRAHMGNLSGFVRFGAYQMGERTINFLGFNLDKLLIGGLIGVQSLGYYNLAYQLMSKPMQILIPVVTRVAFPLFARLQHDDARLRDGYLDIMRLVGSAMFPIYAGMIVLAEPLVRVVLGEAWFSAVPAFRLLCVLGVFYSIGTPVGSLLLAKGRVQIGFYLNVWMILLYTLAVWIGASAGLPGVAAGLVIATALGLFPVGFLVRWFLVRMRPMEYLAAILPALGCALASAAVIAVLMNALGWSGSALLEVMVMASLGAVLYLVASLVVQGRVLLGLLRRLQ